MNNFNMNIDENRTMFTEDQAVIFSNTYKEGESNDSDV